MKTPALRSLTSHRLLTALLLGSLSLPFTPGLFAADGAWAGASANGLWSDAGNWSASPSPGSTSRTNSTETATFNTSSGIITIDAGRNLRTFIFDTGAGAFTLGSAGANAGNALVVSGPGSFSISSTFAGSAVKQTFNAPLQLFGNATFQNASLETSNSLNFAGDISSGTASAVILTLSGTNTGDNSFSSVIGDGSSSALGIIKALGATWTLTGANTYTGNTTVSAGMLKVSSDTSLGAAPGSPTAGKIVLVSSNPASSILAATDTFALSSNRGLTLGSATANSGGSISVAPGATLTYGGVIAGAGTSNNFVKTGSGTLALGGANTYGGATQVLGGTLHLDFTAAGAPTNNILASGGIITIGSNLGNVVIAGSATLSLTGNATHTQTLGNLTTPFGAAHINLDAGAGNLTLALGTLATRSIGSTLNIKLTGNSVVTTTSTTTPLAGVALAPGLTTLNGTDFVTISGGQLAAISPGSYISNTGTTLGTANQTVDMTVAATTLSTPVATLGNLRFNTAQDTTITLTGTGALSVGGGNAVPGQILVTNNMGNNTARITGGLLLGISNRDLVVSQHNPSGLLQIDSTITDQGSSTNTSGFTKSGAGTALLNGRNAFQGLTFVNEGRLIVAGDALAAESQTLTATSGNNTISGVDTTNLIVGERISGAGINGSFYITAMSGTGLGNTITLSAKPTATSTGSFNFLGAGALGVSVGGSSAGSSIQVANGATLQIGNGEASGTLFAGQSITNHGTLALNRSDDITFSHVITNNNLINTMGPGALTKLGNNTVTLNALNAYQGVTTISGGTLSVGSGDSAAVTTTNGNLTISSNVIAGITTTGLVLGQSITGTGIPTGAVITGINSGGNAITMSLLTGNVTATNPFTFYSGSPLANGGVSSAIGKSSSAAPNLVLDSGSLRYTGASAASTDRLFTVTQNGGGLDASGASNATVNFTNPGAVAFSGSGARALALSGSSTGNNTLSAVVGNGAGGSTSLTKSGAGKWVLNAANTYSGDTTISGGTLELNASNALPGTSAVSIGGGTLAVGAGLTGTAGTLDLTGAATIDLGSSGALVFADSSAIDWSGGSLNIIGTLGATSLRFGTAGGGLLPAQLALVSVDGSGAGTYTLDASGYLAAGSGNTAPTLSDITDLSVPSGGNTGSLAVTVGDTETLVESLTVSAISSNPTLVPNGNIVIGGSGASRTVTVTPVSGLSGSATITVTVTDAGSLTATDTFMITVTDNYLSWAAANSVSGGAAGDSDNDGVKNLIEYALIDGGERCEITANTFAFTKRGAPYGSDITYGIQTSTDLVSWSTPVSGVTENATTISYTFTPGSPARIFARLTVTAP